MLADADDHFENLFTVSPNKQQLFSGGSVIRAATLVTFFLFQSQAWAQAPADDEGQLDAARAAGEAAQKAAAKGPAKAAQKPQKAQKAKNSKPKAKVSQSPFGDMPSWDSAAEATQTVSTSPGHDLNANWNLATSTIAKVGFPWVENHGVFRFRADLFVNFDLDTYQSTGQSSSPFLPPLTEIDQAGTQQLENSSHGRDGESQSSANIRLRYQPTIHISDSLRIRTTVDVLDNVVLGSTPDSGPRAARVDTTSTSANDVYARTDVPLEIFEDGQRPPESGVNAWQDSVRVKRLWAEWNSRLGLLSVGRMPSHWGLGLIANNGNCLDCDFGDSVDRVLAVTQIFDTYLALSWDFPAEGATGFSGTQNARNQPAGQAYDLDQRDDMNQFVISIFKKPSSREELEARNRTLNVDRKPVFDWGVYNLLRSQTLEWGYLSAQGLPPLQPINPSDIRLYELDAFTYTPDIWFDYQYRPSKDETYRVRFEGAATFGSIEEVPQYHGQKTEECIGENQNLSLDLCESTKPRRRDIQRFGYALEFDAQNDQLFWGFHHGLATGDSTGGFGVLDRSELPNDFEGSDYDEDLTAFRFDRDYHVDMIMFREMVGAVTNATYYKPYLKYHFIHEPKEAWGFQLSSIYGHAMDAEATPGKAGPLGLEFDLELFIHEFDRMRWSMTYAVFFPMEGFNLVDEKGDLLAEATTAQSIQMLMGFEF